MKIGLALGSGGARGFAHIGVIKALQEANIPIDCIAGASAGSVVGAYYAMFGEIETFSNHLKKMSKADYIRVFNLQLPKYSILGWSGPNQFLKKFFGDKNIEDAKIPLGIVATDFYTGKEVLLRKGLITEAIMASSAIPGIFTPVHINDTYLIDGGVVNPVPLNAAEKLGADLVIGVDLTGKLEFSKNKYAGALPRIYEIIDHSYNMLRRETARFSYTKARKPFIMIQPTPVEWNSIDFYAGKKLIEAGEKEAKKVIPKIKIKIAEHL